MTKRSPEVSVIKMEFIDAILFLSGLMLALAYGKKHKFSSMTTDCSCIYFFIFIMEWD